MKNKIRKKSIAAIFMALVLVLSLMPTALAASVDNNYLPGTYTGTAQGFKGSVSVTVTLASENGNVVISDIQATHEKETESYWESALTVLDKIKEKNGTDGVDTVSNATFSSRGILDAANEALGKAVSGFAGGSGTQDDPYQISSEAGLRFLQTQVANGTTYAGQYVELTSDITLTDEWTPIGSSADLAFAGTFDGNSHTITGMTITALPNPTGLNYIGLFGYTLNGVVIRNVNLENVKVTISGADQNVYVGALVGFIKNDTSGTASSVIDGCTASGSISVTTVNKVTVVGGLTGFTAVVW